MSSASTRRGLGTYSSLNRAKRGQLERCRRDVVVVALARVGRQDTVASANNYQQSGYENHPTSDYLCWKQSLYRAYTL